MPDNPPNSLLPAYGNYRELLSYRKATVVYDLTDQFYARHLRKGDRTVDQMVRAARSGKQNILEGAKASGTSQEMELKLTNVARASLEELLALRVRGLPLWAKDSKEALYVRRLGRRSHVTYDAKRPSVESRSPAVIANIALCLIHQANYLRDQQIRRLERDFLQHGGLRERLTRARLQHRARSKESFRGRPAPINVGPSPSPPATLPSKRPES